MNLFLVLVAFVNPFISSDSVSAVLPEIEITASPKVYLEPAKQAAMITQISLSEIETHRIVEPKELSLLTPNLFLPDYGSKMTGSMYLRGIGARMEHPSMALYIDNIPVLNKNNYDFDFYDIRQINLLRGPQGALYGRNTIGGVMDIHTLSPLAYQGQRAFVEYGNASSLTLRYSNYQRPNDRLAYSVAAQYRRSDGFFTNQYTGKLCDRIENFGLRFRLQAQLSDRWRLDNSFSMNRLGQDGFAYSLYDEQTGAIMPVNHNDPCTYDRTGLMNGLTLTYRRPSWQFSSTTSYQYTDDEMNLDQDFQPQSMFILTQQQNEHAITQEFIVKSTDSKPWQWLGGAFAFHKNNRMNAPVTFKRAGIQQLILDNANHYIHQYFPGRDLEIAEESFPIESRFRLPAMGASLFHQSSLNVGLWNFTAGCRFDYEYTKIEYHNYTGLHYRITPADFKLLHSEMQDWQGANFYELIPSLSIAYQIPKGNIYIETSRGYKTGGFNTQIFSDILQNKLRNDIMKTEFGMSFPNTSTFAYKPEYSWNYEIGTHSRWLNNRLQTDAALFFIDCTNQQLTVFPPGQSTGRLMSNAGKTAIFGGEISIRYTYRQFSLNGNYGYTNARFRVYNDGNNDYAGNVVPYAPQNTVSIGGEYDWKISKPWLQSLLFHVDWKGAGKIYWNEQNTLSQPFYGLWGASIHWNTKKISASWWIKNATNVEYQTFYFKSIGNSFIQRGKPVQTGISIQINI
ncbi:TonB-dependent receptor [Bacteroidia bacterium]|nr:TonB-dependent receptor [Bacteroidia bacterium]